MEKAIKITDPEVAKRFLESVQWKQEALKLIREGKSEELRKRL